MLFKLFAAGLATSVSFAAAWTQPTGSGPQGNAILTPGSTSIVPVGEPYRITWDPTTNGTVTLLLLKGPSSNAVPQYAIVEHLPNTGSYTWTPATNLPAGTSGYGIELIDDATGQYQYSTQFGISNDASSAESSSSASTSASASASASTSNDSQSSSTTTGPSDAATWSTTSSSIVSTTSAAAAMTTSASNSASGMTTTTSHATISISTSASSAAATATPATGAASTVATSFVGLVFAAAVAVFAL